MPGDFRCEDCFQSPLLCSECCRSQHTMHPFHRADRWNGHTFVRTLHWQAEISLDLYIGHLLGKHCPVYDIMSTDKSVDPSTVDHAMDDTEEDHNDHAHFTAESQGCDVDHMRRPRGLDAWRNRFLTIVDVTGIHYVRIKYCRCLTALPEHRQLLQAGLYPCTQTKPCTAFTFKLLDDCHLENLECKTAFHNYYSKLRRITSKSFPHLVPVCGLIVVSLLYNILSMLPFRIDTANSCASRGNGCT